MASVENVGDSLSVESPPGSISRIGGFPLEILKSPDPKYLCTDCKLILRKPVQSFCGHRYCRSCIETLCLTVGIKCQACEKEGADSEFSELNMEQTFPDNAIKREFSNKEAKCINQECPWTGKMKEYEKHESDCKYKTEECSCGLKIPAVNMEEHKTSQCKKRKVRCAYCNLEITLMEEQEHNDTCPKMKIKCPLCDMPNILREKLSDHENDPSGECRKKRIWCPFKCSIPVEKDSLEIHNENEVVAHVRYVKEKVISLETSFAQSLGQLQRQGIHTLVPRVDDLESRMHDLESKGIELRNKVSEFGASSEEVAASAPQGATGGISDTISGAGPGPGAAAAGGDREIVRSCHVMDAKITTFEGIVAVLNRELEKVFQESDEQDRKLRDDQNKMKELEKKLQSLERSIAVKDVTMAEQDLRLQALELASYDGNLIWKITDFQRKRTDAESGRITSMYSPCFYTGRMGYKMCARIYLNGDGMGRSTHISLFFVLMRGNFDALLKWPFRQKVTLMLLDQNNKDHVIDAFRPDPTSNSFKRPTSEMNIASGCPLFMPLSQLQGGQQAYVKDDTIFIKIVVDTSDL